MFFSVCCEILNGVEHTCFETEVATQVRVVCECNSYRHLTCIHKYTINNILLFIIYHSKRVSLNVYVVCTEKHHSFCIYIYICSTHGHVTLSMRSFLIGTNIVESL